MNIQAILDKSHTDHMNSFPVLQNRRADTRKTTDYYQTVPTQDVVNHFGEQGWRITSVMSGRDRGHTIQGTATEAKSSTFSYSPYKKHIVRMAHPDYIDTKKMEEIPEIMIINSMDGSTRLNIMAGVFRLVCENGLVVGENLVPNFSTVHMGNELYSNLDNALNYMGDQFPKVISGISEMKEIKTNMDQVLEMIQTGIDLRYGEPVFELNKETGSEELKGDRPLDPRQFLRSRRSDSELKDTSLWNMFNLVQENVIRGGFHVTGTKKDTLKVNSIEKNITKATKINTALWDKALEYCPN